MNDLITGNEFTIIHEQKRKSVIYLYTRVVIGKRTTLIGELGNGERIEFYKSNIVAGLPTRYYFRWIPYNTNSYTLCQCFNGVHSPVKETVNVFKLKDIPVMEGSEFKFAEAYDKKVQELKKGL